MADSRDNALRFSVRVDLGQVQADLGEVTAAINTSMAEAADSVSSASAAISTAFAEQATASSSAATTIGDAYTSIQAQGIETMAALSAATTENASVTQAAAEENAASVVESISLQQAAQLQLAAATLENAAAQGALRVALAEAAQLADLDAQDLAVVASFQRMAAESAEQLALAKRQLVEVTEYENAQTEVEIAVTEAATLAERGFTAAKEQAAAATGHTTSSIAAASGAIREFEGRIPIRAVERFAVTTLELGPRLEVAFPVIGAIALGEVLLDVGEKAYAAVEKVEQAGTRIDAAWKQTNSTLMLSNDTLTITADKLDNTLAKLEHKPENGLRLGLDEARESADQLAVSLQKDLDKVKELVAKNQIGIFGQLLGKVSTADSTKLITDVSGQIATIKNSYQETIDSAVEGGSSQQNIVDIKIAELARLEGVYASAEARIKPILHSMQQDMAMFQESGGGRGRGTSANVALLSGYLQQIREEQRTIGENFRVETDRQQIAPLQAAKAGKGPADTADRDHMRADEEELALLKQSHQVTLKEEHEFWEARVGEFSAGSAQYAQVQERIARIDTESANKAHEAIQKFRVAASRGDNLSEAGVDRGVREMDATVLKTSEDVTQSGARWKEYHAEVDKESLIQATNAASLEKATLRVREQMGAITPLNAARVEAAIHTEEYRVKIAALTAELERLRAEETKDPITGANSNAGNAKAQANVQNQINALKGQGAAAAATDSGNIQAQISKPYLAAFDSINSAYLNVQAQMIRGTRSISQAFANMGVDLLTSLAANFERMLITAAEHEVRMVLLHSLSNEQKVASDVGAAAQSEGISALSALKQMAHAAAVAAGNTWAAVSAIPIVGPILAPPAAAAAYVGVMALAAFDTGGIIPNTGIALVHKEEAVLPAPLTNMLMDAAGRGGSSSSSSASMVQNNHFHGPSDAQFRRQAMRNGQAMLGSVHRQVRSLGRA